MTDAGGMAVVIVGLVVGALSSGAVGLGFPIVMIPALALGFGLETAVIVSAFPALVIDVANLAETRDERHRARGLVAFGAIAACGAVVGSLVRSGIDERILSGVLVVAIGAFIVSELFPSTPSPSRTRGGASIVAPVLGGLLQSTVGIASPIMGTYFLNRTETRRAFIFHLTSMFVLIGTVRLVVIVATGDLSYNRTVASLSLAVVGLVGRAVGSRLGGRLDKHRFRRVVVGVLAASLIPLLARSF